MLTIQNLSVSYNKVPTVKDVSFTVEDGEIFSIIGKSGCGKSTILNAVCGMLGRNGEITSGAISFLGQPLFENGRYTPLLKRVRGKQLAYISQHPAQSLDPVFRIGNQMTEAMRVMENCSAAEAHEKGCALLESLRFDDPERVWRAYPHELSGGMCQRVAIAMALANRASLLLADEPTSALDVTIQAQLIDQLREISQENKLSILLVTHNLEVGYALSGRIGEIENGVLRIRETGGKRSTECRQEREEHGPADR